MGCDIHTFCERLTHPDGRELIPDLHPFEDGRSYALFGWLAGVRNYSAVTPLSKPRGLPPDTVAPREMFEDYYHSASYVTLDELLRFDYSQMMEDRRVTINGNGGCTAEPGGGVRMTYAVFLGPWYFAWVLRLYAAGVDRIVFGFDS